MTITEIVKQLGLPSKEEAVYGACLEFGPLRAKEIADHTDVNRGTVYDTSRSLFKKGLLGSKTSA